MFSNLVKSVGKAEIDGPRFQLNRVKSIGVILQQWSKIKHITCY